MGLVFLDVGVERLVELRDVALEAEKGIVAALVPDFARERAER